jgi:ABC-type branched-subunit amino acid transport system substrate-binding protein
MHMGVDAFVGPMVSEVAEVVSALSMQDHVPVVGYRSSMSKLTESSVSGLNHFMRTFPSDRILMKGVVDLIQVSTALRYYISNEVQVEVQ